MQKRAVSGPRDLVAATEARAFTILPGRLDVGVLVLCDHAGNAFPEGYGTLGLPSSELERHIAYDIGAAGVARTISERLGAPAILTRYSRLLIDCNRGLDDPTLFMRLSDGAVVNGNRHLTAAERARRIRDYYDPYHGAIGRLIDQSLAADIAPALLSIHSFTDTWKGCPRPWHAAVLWDGDPRLAKPLLSALNAEEGLVVGDNEPYSGRLEGDTLWRHGTQRGLAHAIVEVRQDLIRTERGQRDWGERLARIMSGLLSRGEVAADLQEARPHCRSTA